VVSICARAVSALLIVLLEALQVDEMKANLKLEGEEASVGTPASHHPHSLFSIFPVYASAALYESTHAFMQCVF